MYLPQHFAQDEDLRIRKLIENNSFATVLSYPKNEKPFINHLPIIFSSMAGEDDILIGHMARRNPQWQHFKDNPDCTMVFHGGHAYISPQWYKSGNDVPTWNYAVAHVQGKIELVESFQEQIEILRQLTDFFENSRKNPWSFELPADLTDESALTSAIVSFKFHIEKIDSKFKLSQNRSIEDRQGVIEGLTESVDDKSRFLREMMLENESVKEGK